MLRQLTRDPNDPVAEDGDEQAIDAVINLASQSEGEAEEVQLFFFFSFLKCFDFD